MRRNHKLNRLGHVPGLRAGWFELGTRDYFFVYHPVILRINLDFGTSSEWINFSLLPIIAAGDRSRGPPYQVQSKSPLNQQTIGWHEGLLLACHAHAREGGVVPVTLLG